MVSSHRRPCAASVAVLASAFPRICLPITVRERSMSSPSADLGSTLPDRSPERMRAFFGLTLAVFGLALSLAEPRPVVLLPMRWWSLRACRFSRWH